MNKIIFSVFICLLMGSCISHKNTIYLKNKIGAGDNVVSNKKVPYKICPNDVLLIDILSSNTQINQVFNLKAAGNNLYLVNDSGYIYMPVLDSVNVGGKSIADIQGMMGKLIKEHVTDAIVNVTLGKFNVTVLGEVNKQGTVSATGTELTIIEALGLAGGISEYGNKRTIELIRKEGEVTRFVKMDLTDRAVVSSEYYFLQPNDVLYVEPVKAKNIRTNISQITLFIGIASFILILNNYLKVF